MMSDPAKAILEASQKGGTTVPALKVAEVHKPELSPFDKAMIEDTVDVLALYIGESIERRDSEARARAESNSLTPKLSMSNRIFARVTELVHSAYRNKHTVRASDERIAQIIANLIIAQL